MYYYKGILSKFARVLDNITIYESQQRNNDLYNKMYNLRSQYVSLVSVLEHAAKVRV